MNHGRTLRLNSMQSLKYILANSFHDMEKWSQYNIKQRKTPHKTVCAADTCTCSVRGKAEMRREDQPCLMGVEGSEIFVFFCKYFWISQTIYNYQGYFYNHEGLEN